MKYLKKIKMVLYIVVVVFAAIIAFNVNVGEVNNDLTLANVEALAQGESSDPYYWCNYFGCIYWPGYTCNVYSQDYQYNLLTCDNHRGLY